MPFPSICCLLPAVVRCANANNPEGIFWLQISVTWLAKEHGVGREIIDVGQEVCRDMALAFGNSFCATNGQQALTFSRLDSRELRATALKPPLGDKDARAMIFPFLSKQMPSKMPLTNLGLTKDWLTYTFTHAHIWWHGGCIFFVCFICWCRRRLPWLAPSAGRNGTFANDVVCMYVLCMCELHFVVVRESSKWNKGIINKINWRVDGGHGMLVPMPSPPSH